MKKMFKIINFYKLLSISITNCRNLYKIDFLSDKDKTQFLIHYMLKNIIETVIELHKSNQYLVILFNDDYYTDYLSKDDVLKLKNKIELICKSLPILFANIKENEFNNMLDFFKEQICNKCDKFNLKKFKMELKKNGMKQLYNNLQNDYMMGVFLS